MPELLVLGVRESIFQLFQVRCNSPSCGYTARLLADNEAQHWNFAYEVCL